MAALNRRQFALGALALPALANTATAQVTAVRFGKQYGLPFLPQMVMEAQRLVEKHAAQKGLAALQVDWLTMSGPAALNDALMSGNMEFVNVAPPSLATLWEKSANTARPARAVCTVQSMPYVLVTRNPNVKTIADFTDKDKIALPAVKLTGHAIALEMEAARIWGPDHFDKLDSITITRSHADAAAAVMSGQSEINSHFASAPFYYYELATPGIHQVLKSYDALGARHTNGVLVTAKKFHDDNPKMCGAVVAALEQADAFIKAHPREAA